MVCRLTSSNDGPSQAGTTYVSVSVLPATSVCVTVIVCPAAVPVDHVQEIDHPFGAVYTVGLKLKLALPLAATSWLSLVGLVATPRRPWRVPDRRSWATLVAVVSIVSAGACVSMVTWVVASVAPLVEAVKTIPTPSLTSDVSTVTVQVPFA